MVRVWVNSTEMQSRVEICAAGCFGSVWSRCDGTAASVQVAGAAASAASAEEGVLPARGRTGF